MVKPIEVIREKLSQLPDPIDPGNNQIRYGQLYRDVEIHDVRASENEATRNERQRFWDEQKIQRHLKQRQRQTRYQTSWRNWESDHKRKQQLRRQNRSQFWQNRSERYRRQNLEREQYWQEYWQSRTETRQINDQNRESHHSNLSTVRSEERNQSNNLRIQNRENFWQVYRDSVPNHELRTTARQNQRQQLRQDNNNQLNEAISYWTGYWPEQERMATQDRDTDALVWSHFWQNMDDNYQHQDRETANERSLRSTARAEQYTIETQQRQNDRNTDRNARSEAQQAFIQAREAYWQNYWLSRARSHTEQLQTQRQNHDIFLLHQTTEYHNNRQQRVAEQENYWTDYNNANDEEDRQRAQFINDFWGNFFTSNAIIDDSIAQAWRNYWPNQAISYEEQDWIHSLASLRSRINTSLARQQQDIAREQNRFNTRQLQQRYDEQLEQHSAGWQQFWINDTVNERAFLQQSTIRNNQVWYALRAEASGAENALTDILTLFANSIQIQLSADYLAIQNSTHLFLQLREPIYLQNIATAQRSYTVNSIAISTTYQQLKQQHLLYWQNYWPGLAQERAGNDAARLLEQNNEWEQRYQVSAYKDEARRQGWLAYWQDRNSAQTFNGQQFKLQWENFWQNRRETIENADRQIGADRSEFWHRLTEERRCEDEQVSARNNFWRDNNFYLPVFYGALAHGATRIFSRPIQNILFKSYEFVIDFCRFVIRFFADAGYYSYYLFSYAIRYFNRAISYALLLIYEQLQLIAIPVVRNNYHAILHAGEYGYQAALKVGRVLFSGLKTLEQNIKASYLLINKWYHHTLLFLTAQLRLAYLTLSFWLSYPLRTLYHGLALLEIIIKYLFIKLSSLIVVLFVKAAATFLSLSFLAISICSSVSNSFALSIYQLLHTAAYKSAELISLWYIKLSHLWTTHTTAFIHNLTDRLRPYYRFGADFFNRSLEMLAIGSIYSYRVVHGIYRYCEYYLTRLARFIHRNGSIAFYQGNFVITGFIEQIILRNISILFKKALEMLQAIYYPSAYALAIGFHYVKEFILTAVIKSWRAITSLTAFLQQCAERLFIPPALKLHTALSESYLALKNLAFHSGYHLHTGMIQISNKFIDFTHFCKRKAGIAAYYSLEKLQIIIHHGIRALHWLASQFSLLLVKIYYPVRSAISLSSFTLLNLFTDCYQAIMRAAAYLWHICIEALEDIFIPLAQAIYDSSLEIVYLTENILINSYRTLEGTAMSAAEYISNPLNHARQALGFFAHKTKDAGKSASDHTSKAVDYSVLAASEMIGAVAIKGKELFQDIAKHGEEAGETTKRAIYRFASDLNPTSAFWRRYEERVLFTNADEYQRLPNIRGGAARESTLNTQDIPIPAPR
ncbi:hypothetical protein ACFORL_03945 [Legionella dresdenensis]|uniref:Uncharacterized protein n=1 Tax=Legionella dresdenensis TaxID=450200 RepID=A0ABV8CDB7_9GAMM